MASPKPWRNTIVRIPAAFTLSPSPPIPASKKRITRNCRHRPSSKPIATARAGLKILKTLGLYLRENITSGTLVKIDDARFDPMWDACGQLNLPVAIHISDPMAFFTPTDRFNERYEELNNHPDWSFYGGDFPSNDELIAARNRVIARHPKTQFVTLHVGNFAEDLQNVSENLDRFPNMSVDIAARIGELGRQPMNCAKVLR